MLTHPLASKWLSLILVFCPKNPILRMSGVNYSEIRIENKVSSAVRIARIMSLYQAAQLVSSFLLNRYMLITPKTMR